MSKVIEVQPHFWEPEDQENYKKVFLAGTIDMGKSIDWQDQLVEFFNEYALGDVDYLLFNPRRDASYGGFTDNKPEMEYQINWELERLENADLVFMNILGTSYSPISLLELGLFAKTGKLVVVCPPDFYRYQNVKITCERYGVTLLSPYEVCTWIHDYCCENANQKTFGK